MINPFKAIMKWAQSVRRMFLKKSRISATEEELNFLRESIARLSLMSFSTEKALETHFILGASVALSQVSRLRDLSIRMAMSIGMTPQSMHEIGQSLFDQEMDTLHENVKVQAIPINPAQKPDKDLMN